MRKAKTTQKVPFPAPDVVTKVVPAPTDGWDAISPLASMDPKRAPILDNWVPRPGYVELRAGYDPWTWVGSSAPVETLMVRRGPTAQQMFAAAGGGIYDVSDLGLAPAVVTGLSSARWNYVNFTPGLGTTVIQCCNGLDQLRQYDGSSWTIPAITGLPGGLSSAAITNIYAQKRRLWYILGNGAGGGSTIVAYMPADAITGAIDGTIDFGALWTKGGYLVAMSDWTIDGGNGPQDYAVFVSSRGQVSIFQGSNPSSSTTWSLVGTFDISPPIGRKCMTKVGSDVAIITEQGVLPLSQALPYDPSADRSVAITARIQNAMLQAAQLAKNNYGWQIIGYPAQQLALLNVPLAQNSQQVQFVMSALTGAWCRFTGWNANCFEIYNDDLYFGGNNGDVFLGYSGGLDLGNSIAADMQCAFNYFDDPGRLKRMTMVQPMMVAGGNINPNIAVDVDFGTALVNATISILTGGALWDVAIWDQASWPAGNIVVTPQLSVNALGKALAVHMTVNISTQANLILGEFDVSVFDTAEFDQGSNNLPPQLQVNAFNAILEMGGFI